MGQGLPVLLVVMVGLVTSTFVVRYTSHRTDGAALSYLQAFKVVLVRGLAAVLAGFLIGRAISVAISSGALGSDVLSEHPYIVILVLSLCGLASFFAFQWVFSRMTGQKVSLLDALRFVFKEFGYLLVLLLVVFCLSSIALAVFELFR